jgi:hypothetical protein
MRSVCALATGPNAARGGASTLGAKRSAGRRRRWRRRWARRQRSARGAASPDVEDHPLISNAHGLWIVSLVPHRDRLFHVRPCEASGRDGVHDGRVRPPAHKPTGGAIRPSDLGDVEVMVPRSVVFDDIAAPARGVRAAALWHAPHARQRPRRRWHPVQQRTRTARPETRVYAL